MMDVVSSRESLPPTSADVGDKTPPPLDGGVIVEPLHRFCH